MDIISYKMGQKSAGGGGTPANMVTTDTDQTISGKKTFSTLPESSVVPTSDNQLANKKYVDDNAGGEQIYLCPSDNTSSADVKAVFKKAIDDYENGKTSYVFFPHNNLSRTYYYITSKSSTYYTFTSTISTYTVDGFNSYSTIRKYNSSVSVYINQDGDVTSISMGGSYSDMGNCLVTDRNYSTPYTPLYDGSPATKKYVDDNAGGTPVYRLPAGDIDVLGMKKGVYVIDKVNRNNANVNLYYSPNKEGNYTYGTTLAFGSLYIFADVVNGMTAGTPIGIYPTYTSNKLYLYTLKIRGDSSGIEADSIQVAEIPDKYYVQSYYRTITGYDASKTQILKNVQGTLTWIDE